MTFFKLKLLILSVVFLSGQFIFSQDSISLGLDEAIQFALQKNSQLLIANYQINSSEFALQEAKANLLPKLSLNGSYSRNIDRQVIFFSENFGVENAATKLGSDNEFRSALNLSFPLFSKYNNSTKKLMQSQFNFQKEVAIGLRFSIINATKKTYINYLIAQEIVKVQQERLKNANEFLADIEKRLQKGVLTEFDVTSAKVQVAIAKNNVLEAQSNMLPIVNNLKLLLGLKRMEVIHLTEPIAMLENEVIKEINKEQQLQNNSALKQLILSIELKENQLHLTKSSYFPTLDFIGNYNYQTQSNNFKFSEFDWVQTSLVGLQLHLNLFNGTVTKKRVQQAEIAREIASEEKEYVAEENKLRLYELRSQLEFSKLKVNVQQENMKLTKEALRLAKKRYQLGIATILEVNDAELAQTQARLNWLQSISAYKTAFYDYQLLIGKD